MKRTVEDRLEDVAAAIVAIRAHLDLGSLEDGLVFDAVRMRLLEIGEAVNALPDEVIASEPQIPWRAIAGMRNELAHRYWDTLFSIVATTVKDDLDELEAAVDRITERLR